ncbi:phasin family protein [Undibacterium arcticum]
MQSDNVSNAITDVAQTQFQASLQLADTMISGVEKIDQVLLDNARRLISDELHYAHTLVAERDPKDLADQQWAFFSGTPDAAIKYQNALFRMCSQIQNDLNACRQQYTQQVSDQISEQIRNQATTWSETGKLTNVQQQDANFGTVTSLLSAWQSIWQSACQSVIAGGAERGAQMRDAFKPNGNMPSPAARPGSNPHPSDQRRTGAAKRNGPAQ